MSIVNSVFKYEDGSEKTFRIVAVIEDWAFYVNLKDKKTLPKKIELEKIKKEIAGYEIIQISDPYAKVINEEDIPDKYKQKRDSDYKIAKALWEETGHPFLLQGAKSNRMQEVGKQYGKSLDTVKRILSRYLVRGMSRNALLNDYKNSGASGIDKPVTSNKRGRRGEGIEDKRLVIDDTIKNIILNVYRNQYLTKQKKTYKLAYNYMLSKYFSDEVVTNGKVKHIVWEDDRVPTYQQFLYWCKKYENTKDKFIQREGQNKFNLTIREQFDSINNYVHSPNYKYEVDATIGDIYLVSEQFPDNIIGRPTIYAVMDVFSRLVVGIYVGIENPSWTGAMMALDNVVSDKVEYCKSYDIDITNNDWPQSYIPRVIVADNGEFEGYNVNSLINNFDVEVINLPSSRGDLKPIVERIFRTINDTVKKSMPGAVLKDRKERGEKAYWLEAKLNLRDFIKQVIHLVIKHNKSIINHYMRDKEMLRDDVKPIPIELWNWGVMKRRAAMIKRERNIVRLNLLPSGTAKITKKGIRFKVRLYYSCITSFQNQWFVNNVGESLHVVYDPRNMNQIYIVNSDCSEYEVCNLTKACSNYYNQSLNEIEFMAKLDRRQKSEIKRSQRQLEVDTITAIQDVMDEAEHRYSRPIKSSDRQRGKDIKENRNKEKSINRKKEFFNLDNTLTHMNTQIIDINRKKEEELDYSSNNRLSRIKKMKEKYRDE